MNKICFIQLSIFVGNSCGQSELHWFC